MGVIDLVARVGQAREGWARFTRDPGLYLQEGLRSLSEVSDLSFFERLVPGNGPQAMGFLKQHRRDRSFFALLESRHRQVLGRPVRKYQKWCDLLYVLVRLRRPKVVVETGVFHGWSAAFILKALKENGEGELYSIDLPARAAITASTTAMESATLPAGHDPGWLVPDGLRKPWILLPGSSRDLLPGVLAKRGRIDIFLHDSLHTTEHMLWEYETAWPALSGGGLLLSDDVFWNHAFRIFAMRIGRPRIYKYGLGAMKK